MRGGALAIRARDAHHEQGVRRLAIEARGDLTDAHAQTFHGKPGQLDLRFGNAGSWLPGDRDRAAADRLLQMLQTMRRAAAHREEQIARRHMARVHCQPGHLQRRHRHVPPFEEHR
jgi:hypothetical protein